MPELPEVETVANGVDARVRGQQIVSVWTSGKPQTFKSSETEIVDTLTGARIERVRRVGKTIVMDLGPRREEMKTRISSGNEKTKRPGQDNCRDDHKSAVPAAQFLIHLGMTGRLLVSQPDVPWPSHTHAVLSLADGREVRFVDYRRFGRLSVVAPSDERPEGYTGPGAEPTTISAEEFAKLFKRRKLAIKAAL